MVTYFEKPSSISDVVKVVTYFNKLSNFSGGVKVVTYFGKPSKISCGVKVSTYFDKSSKITDGFKLLPNLTIGQTSKMYLKLLLILANLLAKASEIELNWLPILLNCQTSVLVLK